MEELCCSCPDFGSWPKDKLVMIFKSPSQLFKQQVKKYPPKKAQLCSQMQLVLIGLEARLEKQNTFNGSRQSLSSGHMGEDG